MMIHLVRVKSLYWFQMLHLVCLCSYTEIPGFWPLKFFIQKYWYTFLEQFQNKSPSIFLLLTGCWVSDISVHLCSVTGMFLSFAMSNTKNDIIHVSVDEIVNFRTSLTRLIWENKRPARELRSETVTAFEINCWKT